MKTTTIALDAAGAATLREKLNMVNGQALLWGRIVREDGPNAFSFSGSNSATDKFEALAASCRASVPAEPRQPTAATERQISYLTHLVQNDPGAAMTIGASTDGSRPVDGLTAAQASRFISLLREGV